MRQDPCLGCVRGLVVRMEFKIRERKNVCDPLPVSCQPLCPQPEQCTLWNMKNRILYCKARLCGCRRDRGTGVQGSTWSNLSVCGYFCFVSVTDLVTYLWCSWSQCSKDLGFYFLFSPLFDQRLFLRLKNKQTEVISEPGNRTLNISVFTQA